MDTITGATTQGSILYRDLTGWGVLLPGTSGQYLQTQGTSANPAWANAPTSSTNFSGSLSGDVSGTQTMTSVDKIKGTTISNTGLATGKYLRYNGSAWSPSIVGINDLVSSVTGLTQFTSSSCTTNQTLNWSALTDAFTCQSISLPMGQVTGLGSLASKSSVNLSGSDATGTLAAARMPPLSGDVTTAAGSTSTTIANSAVTAAKIANGTITDTQISASAAIDWSKINKTGALASDIGAAARGANSDITSLASTTSVNSTTSLSLNAGGTNQNVNLVPTGTGTVDVATRRITSVGTPTQTTDAATKAYVDAASGALNMYSDTGTLLGRFIGCMIPPCSSNGLGFGFAPEATGTVVIIGSLDYIYSTTRMFYLGTDCTGGFGPASGSVDGIYTDGVSYFRPSGSGLTAVTTNSYRDYGGSCVNSSVYRNIVIGNSTAKPKCGLGCKIKP